MLVPSYDLIKKAQKEGYAVPAFNAENMEMVQGIIAAAQECNSPVIIQTTPPTVKYITSQMMHAMVSTIAQSVSVPVALHLDHCDNFDDVMKAIKAGYTSVMFDGSKKSLEENTAITKRVVEVAKPMGITVEAELGTIGGKEDNVSAQVQYTSVEDAVLFAEETEVDILAIAIGTAHGFYKGEPKLDFTRLAEIREKLDTPLVLHGGSGIPEEKIKRSIQLGMAKINFATELRAAATAGVRDILTDTSVIDPKKYMGKARELVKQLCVEKIKLCGSAGKANMYISGEDYVTSIT